MTANSISRKFYNTTLYITFAAVALLTLVSIVIEYIDFQHESEELTKNYISEQEAIVHYEVDRVVKGIESRIRTSNIPSDKLQIIIIEELRNVRFPNKGNEPGFFFIRTFDGIQKLSVSLPKIEGTDVSRREDPDGIVTHDLFMSIVNTSEGGFADYSWYNPHTKDIQKKRSYIKAIPELKWYIGAGFWLRDINSVIETKKAQLLRDVRIYILTLIMIAITFYLVVFLVSRNISNKMKFSFQKFADFFDHAATKQARIKSKDLYYKEFKDLAHSANTMISERIKADEDVKVMAHALKSITDCVTITDLEKKILYVNNSFLKTYGYNLDDLIGKELSLFSSDKNPIGLSQDILKETFDSGWSGELWCTRQDGSEFQVHLSSSLIKNAKGETVAILNVSRDITNQKRADLLQRIIYNIAQAANTEIRLDKLIDVIKNELSKIIDIKNFYVAFYNEEDDTFSTPYMIDENDEFEKWPAGKTFTAYVYRTGKPQLLTGKEMQRLKDAGEVEYVGTVAKVWLGVPLIIKGKVFGVFAVQNYSSETAYSKNDMEMLEIVSHQISISIERKRAEEELQIAYERAKESDRLKSTFLATMSHELRTPLNAVIGFSELLSGSVSLDKVKKFAETINVSGKHLLEIVDGIFDVTLLEVGQIQLQKKNYSLTKLMHNINDMILAEKAKQNSPVDIILRSYYNQDNEIFTDTGKLTQIILNLLKNALKFTSEGVIEYGYKLTDDKKLVEFFVKDTGIGIAEDKKDVIFDIFRQADDSLTRLYGGTGIGLFIVKKYTELLGGTINVESEPEKGSTFKVGLPIIAQKQVDKTQEADTVKPSSNKHNNKKILIVEDDKFSSQLLVEMIETKGLKCMVAENGKVAVSMCEQYADDINLILMDLKMPEMDGFEAKEIIKGKWPNLNIIAQTAHAVPGDREKALQNGFDDYISKPINIIKLDQLFDKYL